MNREQVKTIIGDKLYGCDLSEMRMIFSNIIAKLFEVGILSETDIKEFSIYE